MGLTQAQVGTFIVPIGDLMVALKEERKTETEAVRALNMKLRALVRGEEINVPNYGGRKRKQQSSALDSTIMTVNSDEKDETEINLAQSSVESD